MQAQHSELNWASLKLQIPSKNENQKMSLKKKQNKKTPTEHWLIVQP